MLKDPSVAKIIQKQFLYEMEQRADILSLINTCIHCLTLEKKKKEKYVLTIGVSEALRDEKRCNNLKKHCELLTTATEVTTMETANGAKQS